MSEVPGRSLGCDLLRSPAVHGRVAGLWVDAHPIAESRATQRSPKATSTTRERRGFDDPAGTSTIGRMQGNRNDRGWIAGWRLESKTHTARSPGSQRGAKASKRWIFQAFSLGSFLGVSSRFSRLGRNFPQFFRPDPDGRSRDRDACDAGRSSPSQLRISDDGSTDRGPEGCRSAPVTSTHAAFDFCVGGSGRA